MWQPEILVTVEGAGEKMVHRLKGVEVEVETETVTVTVTETETESVTETEERAEGQEEVRQM